MHTCSRAHVHAYMKTHQRFPYSSVHAWARVYIHACIKAEGCHTEQPVFFQLANLPLVCFEGVLD